MGEGRESLMGRSVRFYLLWETVLCQLSANIHFYKHKRFLDLILLSPQTRGVSGG